MDDRLYNDKEFSQLIYNQYLQNFTDILSSP